MGGCIRDTVEADRGLGSRAEVALGWSLYEIYSVQKFDQSRHLTKTKLHPEYPPRKKMNPALKQEISVFCEPEHPKKHATLI